MKMLLPLVFILQAFSVRAQLDPFNYTVNKSVKVRNAALVSVHPLASDAGLQILKKGGNAIDAAIATQLALAVVYPGAGNIGGGGFLVARLNDGRTLAIDYREKAPNAAHRDMYLDSAGNVVKDLSVKGHRAAGVPGTIAGLFKSHQYGKLHFRVLIEPAIRLARGFVITENEARGLNISQDAFTSYNTRPTAFLKPGGWKAGDTLVQEELARTLERIRDQGMQGFYGGETAQYIVEEMQRGGGLISLEDLAGYEAVEREAVIFPYKKYQVVTMPLPSSAGIVLQQMLKMTENRNIRKLGFHSPAAVQLMVEVERRAYSDRATYLGDMDYVKVPVEQLVDRNYLESRMKDFVPGKAGNSDLTVAGNFFSGSEETTHLSVIDSEGNAVAVTTTLNGGYGCYTVVGGAGFLLNNEMDDFSVKPGVPNMYGALGTEANAIAPGKRMLSSMTPTILLKKGKPYIVVGTPGGTTITTSVYQSIVNLIDFKLSARDAVNKPKFHHQWKPDLIFVEHDFPVDLALSLEAMGYTLRKRGSIGHTELIVKKGRRIEAVGDKRGDDTALGYLP